jgi:cell filamentation protein
MPDKYGVGQDVYCYPDSDVLKNLLGITDGEALRNAEVAFTFFRHEQYEWPAFRDFSLSTLKSIHFYLFQDVYDWAGEIRTVDISKGSTRFANWSRIEPEADKLFGQLERENFLRELPKNEFVGRLAHYFCELNVIHPFREGNGRAQRVLFEFAAINAGFELRWNGIDKQLWIPANATGYSGNLEPLIDLFMKAVERIDVDAV